LDEERVFFAHSIGAHSFEQRWKDNGGVEGSLLLLEPGEGNELKVEMGDGLLLVLCLRLCFDCDNR
jgi:hypothetical protein